MHDIFAQRHPDERAGGFEPSVGQLVVFGAGVVVVDAAWCFEPLPWCIIDMQWLLEQEASPLQYVSRSAAVFISFIFFTCSAQAECWAEVFDLSAAHTG